MSQTEPRFQIIDFADIPAINCPCGTARRALGEIEESPITIHKTEISVDAKTHYHQHHTETYYILDCEPDAQMELDGERFPIKQGTCIYIPPGVRHRAVGKMTILNIVSPKFDPADEHVDSE